MIKKINPAGLKGILISLSGFVNWENHSDLMNYGYILILFSETVRYNITVRDLTSTFLFPCHKLILSTHC